MACKCFRPINWEIEEDTLPSREISYNQSYVSIISRTKKICKANDGSAV